jgi:tRNA pseudouridine55 synthase
LDGFVCVNKPAGPSSFDCIRVLKQRLKGQKIGHAGTLDPAASGLLVLAFGHATALLPYVTLEPKHYDFKIQFGVETDTLDGEGKILRENGPIPSEQELAAVLPLFLGETDQVPPNFSAVKVAGQRAFDRARKNESFVLQARSVRIYSLSMTAFSTEEGTASCALACSGGTYVRSLARDIAAAVKSFGYAGSIHRLACGRFSLKEALSLSQLQTTEPLPMLSLHDACSDLSRVEVSEEQLGEIRHGRAVTMTGMENSDVVIAFDKNWNCVAVLRKKDGTQYRPARVFI